MLYHTLPGTSGVLSPFGKIDGLYFNNSREPDDFMFDFKKDIKKIMDDEDVEYLEIKVDNKDDYYKLLSELSNFNDNAITVSGTSKDVYTVIVENEEDVDKKDK